MMSTSTTLPAVMVLLTTCLDTLRDVEISLTVSSNSSRTNDSISDADALTKEVRVLCWVMTHPKNHMTKALHVKATWGKRCNKLLFMSTQKEASLPTIKLPVKEGRHFLWGKTKAAFKYVYDHHMNDADWFLKADDDTYVVVENVRLMLAEHNPSDPLYFGYRYNYYVAKGYMSGGAGYVLSKEALVGFVNRALPSPHLCKAENTGAEDVEMGICLNSIGVKGIDGRDDSGNMRFIPTKPQDTLHRKYFNDCCSDYAISFHYVDPIYMYLYDFLVYQLRTYGIKYGELEEKTTTSTNVSEIISKIMTGR